MPARHCKVQKKDKQKGQSCDLSTHLLPTFHHHIILTFLSLILSLTRTLPLQWRPPPPPVLPRHRSSRCWLPRRASSTSLAAVPLLAATDSRLGVGVAFCSSRRRWAPAPAPAVGRSAWRQAPSRRKCCWAGPRSLAWRRSLSSLLCS